MRERTWNVERVQGDYSISGVRLDFMHADHDTRTRKGQKYAPLKIAAITHTQY